jgi:hypothetical protein
VKNSNGGRPRTEYGLSLVMVKELCMIENNEKGREARRYFIEMKKIAIDELKKKSITFNTILKQYHLKRDKTVPPRILISSSLKSIFFGCL